MKDYPYYDGDDLGAIYSFEMTKFKVWAPLANNVELVLYLSGDSNITRDYKMLKSSLGTWHVEVFGDLSGVVYMYRVHHDMRIDLAMDPYAKAATANGTRGVVIDLLRTNPIGWKNTKKEQLIPFSPLDAVIYETHIRDFTVCPESGVFHKGKYLGLSERNTINKEGLKTGIDHLLELGVSHIHLMPLQDFETVDERMFEHQVLTDYELDGRRVYNWGYDPQNYNVPEGSYSTNPNDHERRVFELKYMIHKLHEAGLKVVIDVVYNHTYRCNDSHFELLAPGYFYRKDQFGNFTNGSGCGNELASERPMVKKFILDSLNYWLDEYDIDGFRFDLLALMGKETIKEISEKLTRKKPDILIYGEPWTGGQSGLFDTELAYKGSQRGLEYSVFNDNFREAIKGDSSGTLHGFISGGWDKEYAIRKGIVGSIYYDESIFDFAFSPRESVNYVSCHDNLTLWDKLLLSCPHYSEEDRVKMCLLAQTIVLTSQGIPFIHGGEEMLKTKYGNDNSYNAGDYINMIDWNRKTLAKPIFEYFKGLIMLRRCHPAFRMRSSNEIKDKLRFLDTNRGVVAYILGEFAACDKWRNIAVIYNANMNFADVELPNKDETWQVVLENLRAGTNAIKPVYSVLNGNMVSVAPISAMILYSK